MRIVDATGFEAEPADLRLGLAAALRGRQRARSFSIPYRSNTSPYRPAAGGDMIAASTRRSLSDVNDDEVWWRWKGDRSPDNQMRSARPNISRPHWEHANDQTLWPRGQPKDTSSN